uniref:Glycosyl transferase family 2 n=1 Tax=Candidatus Kentrum sp. DK TaxID=2126562 RepID=A0A450RWU6_9GAMM|nr:MAG: Glycosyl transferase family 2 [Candidatus Kentron sp. DK]
MKVSLIITTYNRPDALTAVLCTVLSQTRPPDEIIVADDGSGKPTREVVRFFQDNPLVPVLHVWQKDQGFRAARIRNMALARASGDYIIFIDGDILLDKHFISDHRRNAKKGLFLQGGRILLNPERTRRILDTGVHPGEVSALFSKGISGRHKVGRIF